MFATILLLFHNCTYCIAAVTEHRIRKKYSELDLLPLMYLLDFYDIVFFIKALKQPSVHFNIFHYLSFSTTNTRSTSTNKLVHVCSNNNYTRNFYFSRLPKLWPFINLDHLISTIKTTIYLQDHFKNNLHPTSPALIISAVDVLTATI